MNKIKDINSSFRQALKFQRNGQIIKAQKIYRDIIAADPGHFDSHHLLGTTLMQGGHIQQGVDQIARAIKIKSSMPEAHYNLGNGLITLGRLEEAVSSFNRAIALNHRDPEYHLEKGNALRDLKRTDDALACFETAIALRPDYAEAHNSKGLCLKALDRAPEALASFNLAIQHKPQYAEAYANRGSTLRELKQLAEALADYETAIALRPGYAVVYNNRGNVLSDLKRYAEAMECYQTAIKIKPDYADAYYNIGILLKYERQHEESLAAYEKALSLNPAYAKAQNNKADLLLCMERFEEGFQLYHSRWKDDDAPLKITGTTARPWDGVPFDGDLVLTAEQGIGDELFYASTLSLIPQGPMRVTLCADQRLHPVFARSLPGIRLIDRSLQTTGLDKPYDAQATIGDLGVLLGLDAAKIGARRHSYLRADPERQRSILAANPKLRERPLCGISWKSANAKFGAEKSLGLPALAPLLATPGITFVNLQYGDVTEDIQSLAGHGTSPIQQAEGLDLRNDIDGLLALIDACDVVITTSNVTAHLAGGLGKKAAVLVPAGKGRIWYWQGEPQNLWYPSLRMLVQNEHADWSPVISAATDWLKENT